MQGSLSLAHEGSDLDEREYVATVEAADPEELARLLSRPTARQEEVLVAHFGEQRYERMHERALRRNLRRVADEPLGNVVVLHGIMGAALTGVENRSGRSSLLWVQALRLLGGGLARLALAKNGLKDRDDRYTVHASGILKRYYGELLLALSERWRVRAFWYDWRKDLDVAADNLNAAIGGWFSKREPVHLVAHSMGGLVARTFIQAHPERWEAMWDAGSGQPGARGGRLVMLGTPNHGSFDIPRVICGLDRLVRLLALADLRMSLDALRDVLNTFVGTYEMLPSPFEVGGVDSLYEAATYRPFEVSQAHLDNARRHHELLRPVVDLERMLYVAGSDKSTYVRLRDPAQVARDDAYELSRAGDGRVAHDLGELFTDEAKPRKVTTYYARTDHGGLTSERTVLEALHGLLHEGDTSALPQRVPATRGSTDEASLRHEAESQEAHDEEAFRYLLRQVATRDRSRTLRRRDAEMPSRPATEPSMPALGDRLVNDQERQVEDLLVRGWLDSEEPQGQGPARARGTRAAPRVSVELFHGDIAKAQELAATDDLPVDVVAVGHYSGVKPEGAERAIDEEISRKLPKDPAAGPDEGGVLAQLTLRGTIPGGLGQPYFLVDPRPADGDPPDRPRLIALAGMGVPGRFGTGELTVLARELCWTTARMGHRHLASALIGAGNGNLRADDAVDGWVRGIAQGLAGAAPGAGLERISFVELDPAQLLQVDRALARAKSRTEADGSLELVYEPRDAETRKVWTVAARSFEQKQVRQRWQGDQREREQLPDPAPTRVTVNREPNLYRFGAITATAAVPERDVPLDADLVAQANDRLASEANAQRRRDQGVFLGKLLFPADLRAELSSGAPLVLMVDASTARIHWELITRPDAAPGATAQSGSAPVDDYLGIGPGLTRQLRTAFAPPPEPPPPHDRLLRVLVVADPAEDAHLPGAEEEGIAVADLFERVNQPDHPASVEVVRLFGPRQATREAVLRHLMLERFHVLHFAGHCFYDKDDPHASGWIFTGGETLSARELRRIDRVPEFIFSNACESGITPDRAGHRSVDLAPSFAESFFERGVGNFVCTAWPVDDESARRFATSVYASLLGLTEDGAGIPLPMYRAMRDARRTVANEAAGARSWGAYQHYGDPLYRLASPQPRGA